MATGWPAFTDIPGMTSGSRRTASKGLVTGWKFPGGATTVPNALAPSMRLPSTTGKVEIPSALRLAGETSNVCASAGAADTPTIMTISAARRILLTIVFSQFSGF